MASASDFRINFRIKSSENLADELNRLADIISRKAKKDVKIFMKERRNGR